jgi:tRNA threonylcarbamoyladenosine biosynthesis protein TsaE
MQYEVCSSKIMQKLGYTISTFCIPGTIIYLDGEIGVGKTTFVRGFLRGLGYKNNINSPTFNIYEIYNFKNLIICHLDLYRIVRSEDLIYIGLDDYFNDNVILLVEWPCNGKGFIPSSDLLCSLKFVEKSHIRIVDIAGSSSKGNVITDKLLYHSQKNAISY